MIPYSHGTGTAAHYISIYIQIYADFLGDVAQLVARPLCIIVIAEGLGFELQLLHIFDNIHLTTILVHSGSPAFWFVVNFLLIFWLDACTKGSR